MSVPRPRHRPTRHEKQHCAGSAAGLGPAGLSQQTGPADRVMADRAFDWHDRRAAVPRARTGRSRMTVVKTIGCGVRH